MIDAATHERRIGRLREVMEKRDVDAVLIGSGPELEWLTGYAAKGLERLTLLVVGRTGPVRIIVPRLEEAAARAAPAIGAGVVEPVTWEETEDPFASVPRLVGDAGRASPGRVLLSDGMRAAFVLRLQAVVRDATFGVASELVSPLRRAKDAAELELLRSAAAAADRTIEAILAGPLIGRTELEIAAEVRERLVREGHDVAMFAIVAAGEHSASPHHEPGPRVVAADEPLLLDIGGRRGGYCSDITRTVWVAGPAGPDPTFRRIHELVEAGQRSAREAVRPGVTYESLDRTARDVIRAGGFGERFIHRLGHGIGLEVHEEPYLVEGGTGRVAAGETFSIEPGIYLDGRYGVRIEDQVAATDDGVDTLNEAPRELRVVAGI